jgi:uncharacterized membrane protein YgcG
MIDANRTDTMRSVQELTARIAALEVERGFLRVLINWFRISALRNKITALYRADSRYASGLDQALTYLRSLLHSAELAGAEAELAVIDHLRTLPSSAVVFNDVRLKATRYIRFNGIALMSAQIDHVVLTPAGVFVIETKRWSQRSITRLTKSVAPTTFATTCFVGDSVRRESAASLRVVPACLRRRAGRTSKLFDRKT